MKPDTLGKLVYPVLKNPQALRFETVPSSDVIVMHVSKRDMKPVVGKNGANITALKTIIGAIDAIKGGSTKLIVDEPHNTAFVDEAPSHAMPEAVAVEVAKFILGELGCENSITQVPLTDAICLVSEAEIPDEVKDAISRWIQVISMNHGGRRLKLVAAADAAL